MITPGEQYLLYIDLPDEFLGSDALARDLDDAIFDACLDVMRDWKAGDPLLRAMADDRYRPWEWHTRCAGELPVGTQVTYERPGTYERELWSGPIRRPTNHETEWHPEQIRADLRRVRGSGQYSQPYLIASTEVSARLPIPYDISALLAKVDAETEVGRTSSPSRPARQRSLRRGSRSATRKSGGAS